MPDNRCITSCAETKNFIAPGINTQDVFDGLIGFYALTGCDTVSSFSSKGKWRPLQLVIKNQKYVQAMKEIGKQWVVTEEMFIAIGVCFSHVWKERYKCE